MPRGGWACTRPGTCSFQHQSSIELGMLASYLPPSFPQTLSFIHPRRHPHLTSPPPTNQTHKNDDSTRLD
ncbi:hypothetical protein BDZ97DRAFT_1878580, partial [Flammula alnicola]